LIKARVNNQKQTRTRGAIFTLALLPALPIIHAGCEDVALVGRPALDARSRANDIEFIGTVEDFDHDRQELYLRTEGGQSQIVTYTERTRIHINDKEVTPSRLGHGDSVEVRMHGTNDGRFLADSIRLRESAGVRNSTIEGTIEQVLSDRGVIELRALSGRLIRVYLPQGSSERTAEEFRRLRAGDFVRFQGVFLDGSQFELQECSDSSE
jgi:hypothetical protein